MSLPERHWAVYFAFVALLLPATLPWVSQLGLEYDEAHFLPLAVQLAFGSEQRLELPWGVTVADRAIPFVTMPYVGTLDSFLYAAAYRVWGTDVLVSRAVNIGLALGIGLLAYLVLRRVGNWQAGALGLALLLVDVEWVLHVPTNFGPFLLQQLMLVTALWCLLQWWSSRHAGCFAAAMGLLALGFHEKFTFLWVVSSLGLGLLLWEWKRMAVSPKTLLAGLLVALVVVSPLLYFIWAVPEIVLGFGKQSAGVRESIGHVAGQRALGFWHLLTGAGTAEFTTGVALARGPALMGIFMVGLGAAIWARQRFALALYTAAAGVWAWNLIFPEAGRAHHLLLMGPLWHMGAALGIASLPRPFLTVALLLLGWSGVDAVHVYRGYSKAAEATGGVNHWSSMTLDVAKWLDRNPEWQAVTTSWGVARVVETVTAGRRPVAEHYFETLGPEWSAETREKIRSRIMRQGQLWLVSNVMPVYGEQWNRVIALAQEEGKRPLHLKRFPSRNRKQWIDAFTFQLPAPAAEKWLRESRREFRLAPTDGRLRIRLAGPARTGQMQLIWFDSAGEELWRDYRNFYWQPLRGDDEWVFGPSEWPREFARTLRGKGTPARVRIETELTIAQVEVAAPAWRELEEYPQIPAEFSSPMLGEYESGDSEVIVLEHQGKLWALRDRREFAGLDGRSIRIEGGKLCWETECYARRPAPDREFRIALQKPLEELRRLADAAEPPKQAPDLLTPDLVNLKGLKTKIRFDIRYAASENFMGAPLYSRAEAWLQRPAAEALARAGASLEAEGLGLLIHDAYRPWRVTKMFWDATPEAQRNFVANPVRGSRHNRGCAVDLSLYDLKSGQVVRMPSGFDEFSARAWPDYPGGTARERYFRWRLRRAMEAEGFTVNDDEWWHFDYRDWQRYPVLNISFEQLAKR